MRFLTEYISPTTVIVIIKKNSQEDVVLMNTLAVRIMQKLEFTQQLAA